jgi:hypothetical protein
MDRTNWTVKLPPDKREWIIRVAHQNGCSAGKMIEWFIDLCQRDDVILDAVLEASKMKTYKL